MIIPYTLKKPPFLYIYETIPILYSVFRLHEYMGNILGVCVGEKCVSVHEYMIYFEKDCAIPNIVLPYL